MNKNLDLILQKMNASINNSLIDEDSLNTSIVVKTELKESVPEETECLFSQYNEDMEYDCVSKRYIIKISLEEGKM